MLQDVLVEGARSEKHEQRQPVTTGARRKVYEEVTRNGRETQFGVHVAPDQETSRRGFYPTANAVPECKSGLLGAGVPGNVQWIDGGRRIKGVKLLAITLKVTWNTCSDREGKTQRRFVSPISPARTLTGATGDRGSEEMPAARPEPVAKISGIPIAK